MSADNRMVRRGDERALLNYYRRNYAFFKPWEPRRPPAFHEVSYWVEQIALRELLQNDRAACFWVALSKESGDIIAHCSLTNVVQGPFKACYMGYAVDEQYEGVGVMKRLCLEAISYAFNELRLNRIMANHMPENTRSEGLLRSLGFAREGYAEKYLHINGRWEDHVLNALINPAVAD